MAVDSQDESPYGDEAARLPVSLHPAFPAIVALWFAALLGIGSLVLPAALLDRVVSATSLASLLPAASPPLGTPGKLVPQCREAPEVGPRRFRRSARRRDRHEPADLEVLEGR